MKCAKMPESRIKFLNEFCDEFEEALEDFKESRETEDDKDKLISKIKVFKNIPHAINHLLTCYETLYDNACDPTLDYLDFNPEIKAFLESRKVTTIGDGSEGSDGNL